MLDALVEEKKKDKDGAEAAAAPAEGQAAAAGAQPEAPAAEGQASGPKDLLGLLERLQKLIEVRAIAVPCCGHLRV